MIRKIFGLWLAVALVLVFLPAFLIAAPVWVLYRLLTFRSTEPQYVTAAGHARALPAADDENDRAA